MSKFRIKKLPPIRLVDLLRKRKTNLKQFLSSSGIVTYTTLLQKCDKMGVSPPTEQEFKSAAGPAVSSPQEGVVVLDPPQLVLDSGKKIDVDTFGKEPEEKKKEPQEKRIIKKNSQEKKLEIDESIFIISAKEDKLEKPTSEINPEIGDELSVEDNLDSSITKLTNLKKAK
jgi:hypothetical protein